MVLTTRFRYLLIVVAFVGFVVFLRPQAYLPEDAQDYLPPQFRPEEKAPIDITLNPLPPSTKPFVSDMEDARHKEDASKPKLADTPDSEDIPYDPLSPIRPSLEELESAREKSSDDSSSSKPILAGLENAIKETNTSSSATSSKAAGATKPKASGKGASGDISWQTLWNEVHSVFEAHNPKHFENIAWANEWPTMPQYVMNKTFDRDEVVKLSPQMSEASFQEAIDMQASLLASIPSWSKYSSLYKGKGYVMTTGSAFLNRVFPIGIQMLHRLGSELPIEIWTKNQAEYDITIPIVKDLEKQFGLKITCHRFSDYVDVSQFPDGYTSNYLMKAMTMLMSSFQEVIMLDADNVPMLSPEPILSSTEYKSTGLVLWPDFWSNSLSATLHTILNIPYAFHRTCESGQVILDKSKHFESLIFANYYNWYGSAYYQLITLDGMGAGDKDTFVVGAQTMDREFHFTTRPVELLRAAYLNGTQWKEDTSVFNGAMGQFNPLNQSQVMFMHMHSPKLNLQLQEDVTTDLVFVRSDYPDVHFYPSEEYLEKLVWESIVWVECESVLKVKNDKRDVCGSARARLSAMS